MCSLDYLRATIDWTIAPGDPMHAGNDEHYRLVGESALRVITAARMLVDAGTPRSVLDFACANGRVTRWLRAAYPDADLHVADIDPRSAEWSAAQLRARHFLSQPDLRTIDAPRAYDIIWCGSLATHVSPEQTAALLRKFHEWLEPGGIAVVTTHGQRFIRNAIARTHAYFPDPLSIEPLLAQLAATGFGYVPHPGQDHGISAATPAWLAQVVAGFGGRVVAFSENALDDHQDVIAFQRPA